MFSQFGEVLTVFVKSIDPKQLDVLPERKKKEILEHQFAFITFKDPKSASRVVNEYPFLKLSDKKYNDEIAKIVESLRTLNVTEER